MAQVKIQLPFIKIKFKNQAWEEKQSWTNKKKTLKITMFNTHCINQQNLGNKWNLSLGCLKLMLGIWRQ